MTKPTLTEISRGDELVVMPESPLEITRRVNMHDKLVEALEEAQAFIVMFGNDRHFYAYPDQCAHCKTIEKNKELLRAAKESK